MPKVSKQKSIDDYTRIIRFWRLGMSHDDIASEVNCSGTKVDSVIYAIKRAERNDYEALHKKSIGGKNGSPLIVETVLRSLNKWDDYSKWLDTRDAVPEQNPAEELRHTIEAVVTTISTALRILADAIDKAYAQSEGK